MANKKRELTKRLRIVWENAAPCRYGPRATVGRIPGSLGWSVFDRKTDKELTEAEVIALPIEAFGEIMDPELEEARLWAEAEAKRLKLGEGKPN